MSKEPIEERTEPGWRFHLPPNAAANNSQSLPAEGIPLTAVNLDYAADGQAVVPPVVPLGPPLVTVVPPVVTLGRDSIHMICPKCQAEIDTTTSTKPGLVAIIVGAVICLLGGYFGCCLIPCCINDCMEVQHNCPSCETDIGRAR